MLLLFSSQYKGQSPRSNIECLKKYKGLCEFKTEVITRSNVRGKRFFTRTLGLARLGG